MNYLVLLFYPLLAVLLFYKGKLSSKNEWNNEVLSLKQTKALQGFSAVCIMFHHMAQKTCASWIPSKYIIHGLDIFVPIGYLFVGIFFFYSGFGLLKSYKTKENYLKGFLPKRLSPLFVASIIISFIFLVARCWMRDNVFLPTLTIGEPNQINPNGWFPLTIGFFYIVFYLSYRFCKNKKTALWVTCTIVLAYICYCDFLLFGTWWYNSVPAFCTGLIFAEYEEEFITKLKKHYILNIIILVILNVISIYFSVQTGHKVNRFVTLIAQMISSVTFVLLLLVLGMKIQIGNKLLSFLGSMTLELYLIHGLFVHLFGYCFISERVSSLYYIENVSLYVFVVIILSIPSAFLIKLIDNYIIKFFQKRPKVAHSLNKDVLKIVIGICCIAFVLVFIERGISNTDSKERCAGIIPDYIEKNITFADVNGKKMAADIHGEGNHTLVLLTSIAPTLSLKELSNHLICDDFKVVLLDPLGTGFSDEPDTPRTTANIVSEIHTALHQLGIVQPFVLIGHMKTGTYTLAYANTYPQDLEMVINIDSFVYEEFSEELRANNFDETSFHRINTRTSQAKYITQTLLNKTGYVRFMWPLYEDLFITDLNKDLIPVFEETFKKDFYNKSSFEEDILNFENYAYIKDMKYPASIPTIEFIGYNTWQYNYFYGNWYNFHKNMLSEHPLSSITAVAGDVYSIYWDQRMFRQQIRNAVHTLDK